MGRIQLRGNVLNSAGVYNRCKLTRLVVDTDWDKKVWNNSWQKANLGDNMEKALAEVGLMPDPNESGDTVEKRKKTRKDQAQRKKRKVDNEAGEIWGESQSDEVKSFLKSGPVLPGKTNKSRQRVLKPLAGLEWEGRKLLYQLMDRVVDIANHREELKLHLPARALSRVDWEEIPIPANPRSTEEQESLHKILDDMDKGNAGVKYLEKEVREKLGRGRRKKQLKAGRGDQEITTFFRQGPKTKAMGICTQGKIQGSQTIEAETVVAVQREDSVGTESSSRGGDLVSVLCDGKSIVHEDSMRMVVEHEHSEVTCKVRKNESIIHTAGVSFKLFGKDDSLDYSSKGRRKTPLKSARQSNHASKVVQSVNNLSLTNKRGFNDLDLENKSKMAEEFPEQSILTGPISVKKRRISERVEQETKNSGGNFGR